MSLKKKTSMSVEPKLAANEELAVEVKPPPSVVQDSLESSLAGAAKQEAHPRQAELFQALEDGDVDVVEECVKAGVSVDVADDDLNTALILASEGEPEICEYLVAAGANVNAQNKNGVTPLMAAVRYEDERVVELYVEAGADLQLKDRKGRTAVDLAKNNDELLAALGIKSASKCEVTAEVKQAMQQTKRRASVSAAITHN
eukprot:2545159-Prymnesium_polylepis.1